MTRRWALLVIAGAAASAGPTVAQPAEVDLRARLPVGLSMRPEPLRAAADPVPTQRAARTRPPAGDGDRFLAFRQTGEEHDESASLSEKLIVRASIGFGIDGGELNCAADGMCARPPSGISSEGFDEFYYSRLRVYAFGDAVVGSRGLIAPSLNTYLAASYRFDQPNLRATAVPSVHDASSVDDVLVRYGYVESHEFFRQSWLEPLYVRAGRQFRYGPAIAHFDGISVGYDTAAVSLGVYSGTRVSMYGFSNDLVADAGLISGVDARIDMFELKQVPLVLTGAMLRFDATTNFEGGLAIRWSRDAVVRASVRISGEVYASQRLSLRTRLSKMTTISADIESQAANDWPFDLLLADPHRTYDSTDPRRYLDFGPQPPRLHLNLRAGTVLLDNIDVLLRGGLAVDRNNAISGDGGTTSADQAGYLEGGAAIEVRVRRTLALGLAALTRIHNRDDPDLSIINPDGPDDLPAYLGVIGERSYSEGGVNVRFEPGVRAFSANAELYGRLYDLQGPWLALDEETELRAGGRFTVDGVINDRLRMRAEYDVAFAPEHLAPELRSMKSLRVLAEGSF
ncbi:MAG TPA: hypothetical protein VML75_20185 [Kofleriaceae bacterium]|nr:hypothetical protein [Kofleriaceae bacterium]